MTHNTQSQMLYRESYFPILVEYEGGQREVIYTPAAIRSGWSFKVLQTNYLQDMG